MSKQLRKKKLTAKVVGKPKAPEKLHWCFSPANGCWQAFNGKKRWVIRRDGPYHILFNGTTRVETAMKTEEIPDPREHLKNIAVGVESGAK